MRFVPVILLVCLCLLGVANAATPVWRTERALVGVNRPIPVAIHIPEAADAGFAELHLYRAADTRSDDGTPLDPTPLAAATIAFDVAGDARADLASLLPVIWARASPDVLYLQASVGGIDTGPPLVIQPVVPPPVTNNGLDDRILRAIDRIGQADPADLRAFLDALFELTPAARDDLRRQAVSTAAGPAAVSGVRLSILRDIVIETSLGELRFRTRPDAAPRSVSAVARLIDDGWYDDTTVHRVVNQDARGNPFIVQFGDPTGTGLGGADTAIPFEPSPLPHTFGTLSLARPDDDPDGSRGQLIIALSRAGCAQLDGALVPVAELIDGADTLAAIAAVPVTHRDADTSTGPIDRPVEPPRIVSITTAPAAPIAQAPRATRPAPDADPALDNSR